MSGLPDFAPYVKKLEQRRALSFEAREALLSMPFGILNLPANFEFVAKGSTPTRCYLVFEGFVSRFRVFNDGSRQIFSFHVPGDMVNLQSSVEAVADHSIKTNSTATLVAVDHADIDRLCEEYPEVQRAFWFDTLMDAVIFREWAVNVGRRSALARIAHLILEIADKMKSAGLYVNDTFSFPLTQYDLADAMGITTVHTNRVLQLLRGDRLIRTHMRTMSIENEAELRKIADFDPTYLHREGPRRTEVDDIE